MKVCRKDFIVGVGGYSSVFLVWSIDSSSVWGLDFEGIVKFVVIIYRDSGLFVTWYYRGFRWSLYIFVNRLFGVRFFSIDVEIEVRDGFIVFYSVWSGFLDAFRKISV